MPELAPATAASPYADARFDDARLETC